MGDNSPLPRGRTSCYYDATTSSWFRLLRVAISDGEFSRLESEACNPDDSEFDTFILPGFIDAHCHLLESPDEPSGTEHFSLEDLVRLAAKNVFVASRSGITALKDMGGRGFMSLDVVNLLREREAVRLFTTGCWFTSPGGHCWDRDAVAIRDVAEFSRHIAFLVSKGVEFCKIIHADDGFSSEILEDMIKQAHHKGMMVSCHAYTEKAAFEAVLAGTDTLEHAGDYSDSLLRAIHDKDVLIVPTFVAAYDSTPDNCQTFSDIDENLLRRWLDGEKTVIPKLFRAGIKVALGTDSGFPGTPCNSLVREIQLLNRELGITMEELLHSAFIVTPQALRMDKKLGRIAPGYYADFLCFRRNPLEDIEALGYPEEVWIGGVRMDFVSEFIRAVS